MRRLPLALLLIAASVSAEPQVQVGLDPRPGGFADRMRRLAEVVRRNAAFAAPPENLCTKLALNLPRTADKPQVARFVAGVFYREGETCNPDGNTMALRVNDVRQLLGPPMVVGDVAEDPRIVDRGGEMFVGPRPVDTIGGVQRLDAFGDWLVILTKRPEPVFLSVSAEAYLAAHLAADERMVAEWERKPALKVPANAEVEARIRESEKAYDDQIAELEKAGMKDAAAEMRAHREERLGAMAAGFRMGQQAQAETAALEPAARAKHVQQGRERIAAARAFRDALPAEARRAPACIALDTDAKKNPAWLVPCSRRWSSPVVRPNPKFIDPSLPPERIQVVLVTTQGARHGMESKPGFELRRRIYETLDYAALMAVVD